MLAVAVLATARTAFGTEERGPAASAGFELSALTKDYLDAIEQATGHRVGVLVAAVTEGSPAAAAGLKAGDLLYTVGGRVVDSPAAVDAALAGQAAEVAVVGVRPTAAGGWEPLALSLKLAEKAPEGPVVTRKGQTYRHVIGFTFWYPEGWKVVSAGGALQLVPPDAAGTPDKPEEAYSLLRVSPESTVL